VKTEDFASHTGKGVSGKVKGDLREIICALLLSTATMRNIKGCFFWSEHLLKSLSSIIQTDTAYLVVSF